MKKILIILAITMLFAFVVACDGQDSNNEVLANAQNSQDAEQAAQTPAPEQSEPDSQGQSDSNGTNDASETPEDNYDPNQSTQPSLFALEVNGFLIEMDQDIDYVLEALGEPLGVFVAPSCAFDGEDRVFQYPSLQIHTYPVGDNDFVHTISLRDDNIRTTEGGIRLGSGFDDVIAAYGSDYVKDFNMYTFTRERTTLEFYILDGMVLGITFGLII